MVICVCNIYFELIEVSSLKGRRAILNSIKDRLSKLNLSILDLSSEYAKEATLAIAFLAPTSKAAAKKRQAIEEIIYKNHPEIYFEMEYEEL